MPEPQRFLQTSTQRLRAALAATAVIVALLANAAAQEPNGPTGPFTAAQAESGAAVFLANCAGCHGPALEGGFGPRLNPIGEHWHGQSLAALYRFVSTNMPFNAGGSLEPQQYADVVAYVLQQNGYVAGEAPLVPDEAGLATLEAIVIGADAAPADSEY